MVEAQHPAEPVGAVDCTDGRSRTIIGLDQAIIEPLVIPLPVVMRGELASRSPKRPFSEEDHPVETFILDRPDEPFRVGVQVGGTRRQADDLDTGPLQQFSKRGGILRVAIEDDEPLVRQESVATTLDRAMIANFKSLLTCR